jgi:uncharacterized membrane protein
MDNNRVTVLETSTTSHVVERWVGRALRLGVWSSAALMVAGLLVAWFSSGSLSLPRENPPPGVVLHDLLAGSIDPVTLMFAGLLLLMLTPFLRVLTAAIGFAAEKDRRFSVVALVVFAMLLGELILSLR